MQNIFNRGTEQQGWNTAHVQEKPNSLVFNVFIFLQVKVHVVSQQGLHALDKKPVQHCNPSGTVHVYAVLPASAYIDQSCHRPGLPVGL